MKPYSAQVNHLTGLNVNGLERTDIVDVDGWAIGHLCMRIHPTVPGIFCRDLAGHSGKCKPAASDISKRQGHAMPGTQGGPR